MQKQSFIVLFLALAVVVSGKNYQLHDRVDVTVNNVGPFNNPAETYKYYSLPFCSPKVQRNQGENLGEVLAGDRRRNSLYDIRFKANIQWQALCFFRLSQDEIGQFLNAIKEHYIFELFVDDLPVKGFVGETETTSLMFDHHIHNETHYYLFTHLDFSIAYNGNNVIAVNLTTDPSQRVELAYGRDISVEFSYSTHWIKTGVPFADRLELHSRSAIGDQAVEIHWYSIMNSFVLVALLTFVLFYILMRVLKKDFARYMELDEEEFDDDQEETGWKLVHGDVFRFPKHIMVLSASLGTGMQILFLTVGILILSLGGTFYPGNRGALIVSAIVLYALTAGIAGYVSGTVYLKLGGQQWANNAVLTACMFAVPLLLVFSCVNSVAVYYGSSSALPFGTIALITVLWACFTFPLTVLGATRAKQANPKFDAPCKTNRAPREIPPVPWYRSALIQLFVAGFLPFSAIYIELHYIFASVWGHRVYTLFGILSLAFILLLIVSCFITLALTYFQLAAENYHWWWRSFFSGSATGVFMFAYACFYYQYRSEMSGALQSSFFFGYMAVVSYGFSLMLGSLSFFTAQSFVKHIYQAIHID